MLKVCWPAKDDDDSQPRCVLGLVRPKATPRRENPYSESP